MSEGRKVITDNFIGELFSVDVEEAGTICERLERIAYSQGEVIVNAGDAADGLYFIEEGQATVYDSKGEPVNEMGAGHYFGEYAILADEPRMSTVKAHGSVVVYRMSNEHFLEVVGQHPKITGRMLKQVYGQISDKHTKLVTLTRKSRGLMWSPTDKKDHKLSSILLTYLPTLAIFIAVFCAAPHIDGAPVWWQLLPLVFLMAFTLRTKRVVEGMLLTVILLAGMMYRGNFLVGFGEMMVEGIGNSDTAETIVIMAMVESVAALLAASGIVTAFKKLAHKYIKHKRGSLFGMLLIMIVVCLDECLNVVTAGCCLNDISDEQKIPREAKALLGSFSTAICAIIPFSLWSAYISGWVSMYVANGGNIYLNSMLFNLAGIFALLFAFMLCFGILPRTKQIKEAYKRVAEGGTPWPEDSEQYFENRDVDGVVGKPINLFLPMLVWAVSSVVCGVIRNDGAFAIDAISGLIITLIFMFALYVSQRIMTPKLFFETFASGIGNALMPILLLVFAERIAACLEELGSVELLETVIPKIVGNNLFLVPALLFVIFTLICIGLGSCWGTFGLAIPITIFLSVRLGLNVPLCLGAILAAGIVGEALCPYMDESSPVVTSIGCEPHAYRRIRFRYWLPLAGLCMVGYLILGIVFI
ncbi:MAG: cyclic nucleotide-binding domain-containing protein [Lachnospiraceae bacterium]|nr:cyclic nucleotide-binding domain-containing protein [Lachnospiraceae bacterium]